MGSPARVIRRSGQASSRAIECIEDVPRPEKQTFTRVHRERLLFDRFHDQLNVLKRWFVFRDRENFLTRYALKKTEVVIQKEDFFEGDIEGSL
jgi:hypothetical protein